MFFVVAELGVFNIIDVAGFPCRMVLRHVQSVEIKKCSFNSCARHFLEAQLDQFSADFIEKLQVRMLFSRPHFCDRGFNVVLLEFCGLPFARDYEFRG